MQFCKEEFEKEERNLFYYDSIMECLQKKNYPPSIWRNSLCQCLKTELVSMATRVFRKLMLYPTQMTDWLTKVSSDNSITCLCRDVSVDPADDQHHMHDLHVSSTLRCQQGSSLFLHLIFLLQNTENEIQCLDPALQCTLPFYLQAHCFISLKRCF